MTADAVHDDVDVVGGRHGQARRVRVETGEAGRDVLAEHHVGEGEAGVQPVGDHGRRPAAGLLGRLPDDDERARPCAAGRGQRVGGSGEPRDVQIVTAGMHHAVNGGGVLQTGGLLDRQCVHVAAQPHGRTLAVGENTDHPGTADALRHVVAGGPQPSGELRGGAVLLEGELRVTVEVLVEVLQGGGPQAGGDLLREAGDGCCDGPRAGVLAGPGRSGGNHMSCAS